MVSISQRNQNEIQPPIEQYKFSEIIEKICSMSLQISIDGENGLLKTNFSPIIIYGVIKPSPMTQFSIIVSFSKHINEVSMLVHLKLFLVIVFQ